MKFEKRGMGEALEASSGDQGWTPLFKTLLRYAAVIALLFLAIFALAELSVSAMPDSWENRLSSALSSPKKTTPEPPLTSSFNFLTPRASEKDLSRVLKIKEKLMEGRKWRDLDYHIEIGEGGMGPNAFASLGGKITLTPELLGTLKTEEGMAFVIAHELAHHEHRHILTGNAKSLLAGLFFLMIGTSIGETGMSSLSSLSTLPLLSGSRTMEEEADKFAVELVCEKYGNTRNIEELLVWVKENDPESKWLTWASTHPHPEERLTKIKELSQSCSD